MRLISCLLLLVLTAVPAISQSIRTVNRLIVVPINPDTFEVIESRGAGASDIWCAASDYAQKAGLDGARKRLYVLEARGTSKTTPNAIGVVFTVSPDENLRDTPPAYSVSVTRKGENLAIGHAYNFCANLLEDVFDRF